MKSIQFSRTLGALALGAALLTAAMPALSQPGPEGAMPHRAFSEADRAAFAQKRLDHMAARLEIKASQQAAWKAYSQVVLDQSKRMGPPLADMKGDAATVLRARAERMNQHAKNLNQLADATARLSAALTPEQRQVLDQTAREHGRFRHHGGKHGEGQQAPKP
ncbi:Spy/CpxP family protein refolding chaperone [Crenobacter cavernae]|uniref:Periplasmic heavy metal sensor n=1 Tax=Crenobacter cavernae TaxID=2290923 RepID=A0A345Y553_9NEIS|nr:Spy/CpxP family protein refolding chaperone [Crenobacter cavernae]AXK39055.1 hypothetical protein DWG20_06165 [Crenobacter cavernae]